jgi:DNA-binding MarR family transcriptional regulator
MLCNVMDSNERPQPGRAVRAPLPPSLSDSTGFLLSWVASHASDRFNAALAEVGLTAHQLGVMTLLTEGPQMQARLSEQLEVFQPVMVTLINELEGAGLVRRAPHPGDRRALDVHLEPAGAERLARAGAAMAAVTDAVFGSLTAPDREALHRILLHMVRELEPRPRQES